MDAIRTMVVAVVGLLRQHPIVAGGVLAVLLAPVLFMVAVVAAPGGAPPLPPPEVPAEVAEPSTADWASLHAFKTALETSGASGRYVEVAELDERRPYRVVIKVTSAFMLESHPARTQFVQQVEGLWERVREERQAGGGRAVLLVLGPRGQRIGGSTVTGLAEVD